MGGRGLRGGESGGDKGTWWWRWAFGRGAEWLRVGKCVHPRVMGERGGEQRGKERGHWQWYKLEISMFIPLCYKAVTQASSVHSLHRLPDLLSSHPCSLLFAEDFNICSFLCLHMHWICTICEAANYEDKLSVAGGFQYRSKDVLLQLSSALVRPS